MDAAVPFTLVADIGGTNARFALAQHLNGHIELTNIENFRCAEFASLEAAICKYLALLPHKPVYAAVAVAGPVRKGEARLTNLCWTISAATLKEAGDFVQVAVINDFAALGVAATNFESDDLVRVGPAGQPDHFGSVAVIGPGTGFGATALIRDDRGHAIVSSEGGHISFAPCDEVEAELWRWFRKKIGRVSVERLLSGPGLVNLHRALNEIEGQKESPDIDRPGEVSQRAEDGDGLCARTLERFCLILGSVAGDFALAFGATRGVVVAGGMAPQLKSWIRRGGFRERFEDKGRLSEVVKRIPTHILVHPHSALIGAAWAGLGMIQ